ncbi:MAG: HD domain-containing protein [Fibromonadaceae bacterium]|nr:HD domain-containing protein [Fibromonadaceae bacterium]
MERVLLISKEPGKWEYFERNLSGCYEFVTSKLGEKADFYGISIVAIDEIEHIERILIKERVKLPIVFFGDSNDFSTEIKARKLGAMDFFSIPFDKELLLLRLRNVRNNNDNVRWLQMIKHEMTKMQDDMAQTIAETVESRDKDTGGHILRTATFIGMLGDEFVENGVLTRNQLDLIVRAARMHDIGKIGVRDSILLKPGPLTDEERAEMMMHPEKGAILIKKMQRKFESHIYLQYAYDIALNHHERFDGKGYPNGKKGEEIPFCARLMSVVDVYDALVSDRVYRKGMSKEEAFRIIFSGEGTQFDPEVLEAFDNCKDYLI